jgi:hypothetical protein
MPPFGARFRSDIGSGQTIRAATDGTVGKATFRTLLASVGLDSHSDAQPAPYPTALGTGWLKWRQQ